MAEIPDSHTGYRETGIGAGGQRVTLAESPADLVPRPDPTVLTTQLVERALAAFREVMEVKLDALAIATRLAAEKVERMGEQAGHEREAMHAEIDKAAFAMRELLESKLEVVVGQMDEKFAGISRQLEERDERTRTAAQESRISLDAALSAAKEAVQEQNNANSKSISKSEEATAKQLDSLAQLMRTSNQSLDEKIGALKERLDRGEGENRGTEYVRRGEHQAGLDSRSLLFSIIGVVVAVALIALAIVNATGGSP